MKKQGKKGFTIIELLLSMAFLATMLIAIATLTMRILDIYRKGLSMRAINSIGREIISDLTRTIGGSPIVENINPVTTGEDIDWESINMAYRTYFHESFRPVDGDSGEEVQAGGVFCTGAYTYIWNTAPAIIEYREGNDDLKNTDYYTIQVNKSESEAGEPKFYKFARVPDNKRSGCAVEEGEEFNPHLEYTGISENDVVELIGDDEVDLAIYDFLVLPATQNNKTGQIFYSGAFVLATTRGGINVLANGDYCTGKSTDDLLDEDVENTRYDMQYCAVNKFNFAMRATGESYNTDQYGER